MGVFFGPDFGVARARLGVGFDLATTWPQRGVGIDVSGIRRLWTKGGHAGAGRIMNGVSCPPLGGRHYLSAQWWGVAELAKRRTVNPEIGGSNPPAPVDFCRKLDRDSQRELPCLTDQVLAEAVMRLLLDQAIPLGLVEAPC
jgi:hypothetical protein